MSDKVWYVSVGGQQQGPHSLEELAPRFRTGQLGGDTYVFKQGMANWALAKDEPEIAALLTPAAAPAPVPAPQAQASVQSDPQAFATMNVAAASVQGAATTQPQASFGGGARSAHEIDYEIHGEEMQFVEVTLDPQEVVIAEAGAFMYMEPGIQMETIFGDGSGNDGGGLMGKLMGAGKRLLTGESLFMTAFGNQGHGRQKVAFASPYPGKIIAVDLAAHGRQLLCQKDAFLCGAKGVSVGIAFQRKLGAGFFGGEGFILQKLEGDGLIFMHAGGMVVERSLAAGEVMKLDTGCLVAFEQQVTYDIERIKGVKSMFFGGEGLFYATLTGPGKVWIQSLPFSRLANRVYAAAPQTGGGSKGESVGGLGGLGGLTDLVMGD